MNNVEIKSNTAQPCGARVFRLAVSIVLAFYGGVLSWLTALFSSEFTVGASIGVTLGAIDCAATVTAIALSVAEFISVRKFYSYAVSYGASIFGSAAATWALIWVMKTDGLLVGCCLIATPLLLIIMSSAVLYVIVRHDIARF